VQSIQRSHLSIADQSDIEYSTLVCNHGVLLEGRVEGYKGGANGTAIANKNKPSLCALVGVDDQPSQQMLQAILDWNRAVERRFGRNLPMIGHYAVPGVSTPCPGAILRSWLAAHWHPNAVPMSSTPAPQPQVARQASSTFPGWVRLGSRGETVKAWQYAMIVHGVIANNNANRDGVFGQGMDRAMRNYQAAHHLTVDGVGGPQTWAVLCP
jgi:hypothetical protein